MEKEQEQEDGDESWVKIEGQPLFGPMAMSVGAGVCGGIKSESAANSPLPSPAAAAAAAAAVAAPLPADQLPVFKSSSAPLPSTETPDPAESATPMPAQATSTTGHSTAASTTAGASTGTANSSLVGKKGTAGALSWPSPSSLSAKAATTAAGGAAGGSVKKRVPKRPKSSGGDPSKRSKKAKSAVAADRGDDDEASDEDESDSGPYCICRGPDDHRWMICCETCEDWFHGECVHIAKDVGESLIEKFVCPNCTSRDLMTIYKKTCALHGCRRAARLTQTPASVFCSNEHGQTWWERVLARLPRDAAATTTLGDELSQEDFMALLNSGLASIDGDGAWKFKAPFSQRSSDNAVDEGLAQILTEEEVEHLNGTTQSRFRLAEETAAYHKMLSLIEMVQDRRRAAINGGRFSEDVCGYDNRLDTICARDAFAAFLKTSEGEGIFAASRVDDPLGEGDEVRGMCERKRCKAHGGWQKMMVLGIRHQIREMTVQAEEMAEEERIVREAAGERSRRRRAERNWVEVVDC